jgi:hypothetical protein
MFATIKKDEITSLQKIIIGSFAKFAKLKKITSSNGGKLCLEEMEQDRWAQDL